MVDDSDSYAPVVMWSTIRFFIVMAMHLGWITISGGLKCLYRRQRRLGWHPYGRGPSRVNYKITSTLEDLFEPPKELSSWW